MLGSKRAVFQQIGKLYTCPGSLPSEESASSASFSVYVLVEWYEIQKIHRFNHRFIDYIWLEQTLKGYLVHQHCSKQGHLCVISTVLFKDPNQNTMSDTVKKNYLYTS